MGCGEAWAEDLLYVEWTEGWCRGQRMALSFGGQRSLRGVSDSWVLMRSRSCNCKVGALYMKVPNRDAHGIVEREVVSFQPYIKIKLLLVNQVNHIPLS